MNYYTENDVIKYYKQWNKIIQVVWLKWTTKRTTRTQCKNWRDNKNNTNNNLDGIFKMLETEGLICEIDEDHNNSNNNLSTKQTNHCSNIPSVELLDDDAYASSPFCFSSDDLFEAFYLDNAPSPLSKLNNRQDDYYEKRNPNKQETQQYYNNSDTLNSAEIIEELVSISSPDANNTSSNAVYYDNIPVYNISTSPSIYSYNYSPYAVNTTCNYPQYTHNPTNASNYLPYSPYTLQYSPNTCQQQQTFVYPAEYPPHNNVNISDPNFSEFHALHSKSVHNESKICISPTTPPPTLPPLLPRLSPPKNPDLSKLSIDKILSLNVTVRELINNGLMSRLITDQSGSRFLQNLLKTNHRSDFSLLLNHLVCKHDLTDMSEDRYGNYSIQILFEKGNVKHHKILLNGFMYNNILRLSKSEYGCRVIQKALRCINNNSVLIKLVNNLEQQTNEIKNRDDCKFGDHKDNLHECLINSNANHVLQAILNLKLPFETIQFIKYGLEENLGFYSEHVFACRIVQCFIKQYGDKLSINKLFHNTSHLRLCQSMYGNYVIQCIIDGNKWYSNLNGINKFRWKLITELFSNENLLFLSKNKFGSNVIEKCIKVATEKQISGLIMILCTRNLFVMKEMVKHCFGNYVIKTLLKNANKKQQILLIKQIDKINAIISQYSNNNNNHAAAKYTDILLNEVQKIKSLNNINNNKDTITNYRSKYYY